MENIDLEILKLMVRELVPIVDEIVFVGGATVSLFVTEPQFVNIRETFDVDCVVEVSHRQDYEEFSKKLRKIGFSEDIESGVLCRFKKRDLILDLMPTDTKILGFTNIWYQEGFKNSIQKTVDGLKIQTFDLPYLLATKIEAFKGRGKNDFRMSHDIEDIMTLFDGRANIANDLMSASNGVLKYLKHELSLFLSNSDFLQSIEGHVSDRENTSFRKDLILDRLKALVVSG
jgi:predicted nucleotidyltransferase